MARSNITRAINNTGTILPAGKAVYITGVDEETKQPTVALASANDEARMPAIGVTREDVEPGELVVVRTYGALGNFDTSARSPNDDVFVGLDGDLVFEDPSNNNEEYLSQQIGTVINTATAPDGQIFFTPLEVRRKPFHDELRDVRDDQHHLKLHANTHVPGGIDEFIHASQHAIGGGDELNHNSLAGIDDDDAHTQYSLVDGTRAFTGTVSGVYPTIDSHLATKEYVDDQVIGTEFRSPVLEIDRTSPPLSPSVGDRYIVAGTGGTASGAWLNQEEKIAQWTGLFWTFIEPDVGFTVWSIEDDQLYTYDDDFPGGQWITGTSGESNTASNLGAGEGLFVSKVGVDLRFKSLVAGSNISFNTTTNELTINTSAEANNGVNLGAGEGIFAAKISENLQFKSLVAGSNVTLSSNASTITINSTGGSGTPGGSNGQVQYNDGGSFGGDADFIWDDVDKRLGIGRNPTTYTLEVEGDALLRGDDGWNNGGDQANLFLGDANHLVRATFASGILLSTVNDVTIQTTNSSNNIIFNVNSEVARFNDTGLGIGISSPVEKLDVDGAIRIGNATASNDGTIRYTGSDFEGRVSGVWESLTGGGGGVPETTFQEFKSAQEEINDTVLGSLDGYALDQAFQENKTAQNQINDTILQALDGYSGGGGVSETTFQEFKAGQSEINNDILDALDGYGTANISPGALDGYAQLTDLDGYVSDQTFQENKAAQNEINDSIIQALDGYGSGGGDISGSGTDTEVAFFTASQTISSDANLSFDSTDGYLSVGQSGFSERLTVDGAISLSEAAEPESEIGIGKIYINQSTGRLFLKRDNGENIDLTAFDIDGGSFLDTFESTRNFDAGSF